LEGLKRVLDEGKMVKRWVTLSMLSSIPVVMAVYIPLYARDIKGASQYTLGLMDSPSGSSSSSRRSPWASRRTSTGRRRSSISSPRYTYSPFCC
jgi:hypothetical protein